MAPAIDGLTEIVIGKNRHGSVGEAKVKFLGQYSKFVDLTPMERGMLGMDGGDDYGQETVRQSKMNEAEPNPLDDDLGNSDLNNFKTNDDDFGGGFISDDD
jgi:hypothetical protein